MSPLPRYTALPSLRWYYLKAIVGLSLVFVVGVLVLVLVAHGALTWAEVKLVALVGTPVGLTVAALEVLVYPRLLDRLPLGWRLSASLGLYLVIFWLLLLVLPAALSLLQAGGPAMAPANDGWRAWQELAAHPGGRHLVRLQVGYCVMCLFTSLLYQLGNKVGWGALGRLVLGKYHRPTAEDRIFLFVDVRGSTTLAETLGHVQYSHLIRDFFHDMGAPIRAHRGEVYQYVGDEVVVTWPWAAGLHAANCLRCFFAMQRAIDERRDYYLHTYGTVPAFKAALHGGPVMATQVGAIKTELVFHGDVLNTTARMEAQCNVLHSRLLLSSTLYDALPKAAECQFRQLGSQLLRGKADGVTLYAAELPNLP